MSDDFYITLPSHASLTEFPSNNNRNFKIRLPQPIRLEGSGWQVGLSSVSLPDINLNLTRYKQLTEPLMRVKWYQIEDRSKDNDMSEVDAQTTEVAFEDIYHYGNIRDGIDFLKALVIKWNQKMKEQLPPGWDQMTRHGNYGFVVYPTFRWEGEDLILDNSLLDVDLVKTKSQHASYGSPFEISFEKHLAVDLGWVSAKKDGTPILGPNIQFEYGQLKYEFTTKYNMENGVRGIQPSTQGKISDIVKNGNIREKVLRKQSKVPEPFDTDDVEPKTHAGTIPPTRRFWRETNKKNSAENRFHLSCTCNWRFTNIRRAFTDAVLEGGTRSLFVYTDAGGSSIVGNRVTDLLREIRFSSDGRGSQYFEPLHIQYIPVRKQVLDIIEVNVSETTGELARLGKGNTILTLHFRKAS